MLPIEPGVIALVIRSEIFPEYIGRVLTCLSHPYLEFCPWEEEEIWFVETEAPWLPHNPHGWKAPVTHLLPIAPPGVTTETQIEETA